MNFDQQNHEQLKLLAIKRAICNQHKLDHEQATIRYISNDLANPQPRYIVTSSDHQEFILNKDTAEELMHSWLLQISQPYLTGIYPIGLMNRHDIRVYFGVYIATQLTDDDIQHIAAEWMTDALDDTFYYNIDWIIERDFKELHESIQAKFEQSLEKILSTIGFYSLEYISEEILIEFINSLAKNYEKMSKTTEPKSTTENARDFLRLLEERNAVPEEFDITEGITKLNIMDYQNQFSQFIFDVVEGGHPESEYLAEIGVYRNNIVDAVTEHYHKRSTIADTFKALLPTILSIVARTIDPDIG